MKANEFREICKNVFSWGWHGKGHRSRVKCNSKNVSPRWRYSFRFYFNRVCPESRKDPKEKGKGGEL